MHKDPIPSQRPHNPEADPVHTVQTDRRAVLDFNCTRGAGYYIFKSH